MELARSAHTDSFCRDNLPAQALWPEFIFDLPDVQYPERLNCAVELLDRTVEEHGADRPCLRSPDGTVWSYGDLLARANQVANTLVTEHGLQPGNRVMLRGPNNLWLAATWFGVLKAGGVVVPTMPLLRPRELSTMAEIGRFTLAVCDSRFVDDLAAAGIRDLTIVAYGGDSPDDLTRTSARHPDTFDNVDTSADDVSMLAFTSGTTGRPKATMHFHRDVLANADTFSKHVLRPTKDDLFTGTPPIAFTFGLGGLIVFPLRVGASTLLVEKATPDQLAGLIAEHAVTVCFTAPTAYRAMIASGNVDKVQSLRRAVSAGEHLPVATWEAFKDATGVELIDWIGSTEMLHIFIRDEDGYFWYQARSDDMIVSSGYNISGPEVEEAIVTHPDVLESAVVGTPDEARGSVVKAYIVLKEGLDSVPSEEARAAKAKQIQDHVKRAIAPYKYPRQIEFIAALPRTSTGKVQRFRLRQK